MNKKSVGVDQFQLDVLLSHKIHIPLENPLTSEQIQYDFPYFLQTTFTFAPLIRGSNRIIIVGIRAFPHSLISLKDSLLLAPYNSSKRFSLPSIEQGCRWLRILPGLAVRPSVLLHHILIARPLCCRSHFESPLCILTSGDVNKGGRAF